jgi:hypothetical protein
MESAISFAAENLTGPLGKSLKRVVWKIKSGEIVSIQDALQLIIDKWKYENEEFVEAINILKSSLYSSDPEKYIKEAIDVVVNGAKNRMKRYTIEMKVPLKLLTAFGILLPNLVFAMLPTFIIFFPEFANLQAIFLIYNVTLPIILFTFMLRHYFTRPYSYHQIAASDILLYSRKKKIALIVFIFSFISFILFSIFLERLSSSFLESYLLSLIPIFFLTFGLLFFFLYPSYGQLKNMEELIEIENELPSVLLELSIISQFGKPIESTLEMMIEKLKEAKIRKVFEEIVLTIKRRGASLKDSIFDRDFGVIWKYPSKQLRITMQIIVDISRRGTYYLVYSLKSISQFLNSAAEVEMSALEILEGIISEFSLQVKAFLPVVSAVVTGLYGIIFIVFHGVSVSLGGTEFQQFINATSEGTFINPKTFASVVEKMPLYQVNVIVSLYFLEIALLVSFLKGELTEGNNPIKKDWNMGREILISILLYIFISSAIIIGLGSFIYSQFAFERF